MHRVIFCCGCAGFYYALLTGRAFQITTYGSLPDLHDAYEFPNINLTRHIEDADHLIAPARTSYTGLRKYGSEVNRRKYYNAYLVNDDDKSDAIFGTMDLNMWPSGDVETVFLASNRGRVLKLFENSHHAEALYDMGLRPDTAFACAHHFLFEPNAAVKHQFMPIMKALQVFPSALKIGIKVRVSDEAFAGQDVGLDLMDAHVACAKDVEASRKQDGQEVVWYATGDPSAA